MFEFSGEVVREGVGDKMRNEEGMGMKGLGGLEGLDNGGKRSGKMGGGRKVVG